MRTDPPSIWWGTLFTRIALILTSDIFISNFTSIVINQKHFKPLFHLIRSSIKILEFDHVKFPKNISSKDGVSRTFLEIDRNGTSSKNEYFKNMNFLKWQQRDSNQQPLSS